MFLNYIITSQKCLTLTKLQWKEFCSSTVYPTLPSAKPIANNWANIYVERTCSTFYVPSCIQANINMATYTLRVKKPDTFLMSKTSRNINWFSKFFHCLTRHKISYKMNITNPTILTRFWNITVSRGSVTTSLRYGGIRSDYFVVNFVATIAVKEFWNWLIFRKVIKMSRVAFLLTVFILVRQTCVTTEYVSPQNTRHRWLVDYLSWLFSQAANIAVQQQYIQQLIVLN